RTVQETLERAIASVTGEERVRLNASGRTDAGVHAVGQVANFYTTTALTAAALGRAVNAHPPPDGVVRGAADVPQSFAPNKDAVRKLYRYIIHDGPVPDPFLRRFAWHHRKRLDADAMRRASRVLVGRHDFHSFETEWPNRMCSIRTVTHLGVSRFGDYVWFDV